MIISCLQDARGKSCQCSGPHPRAALSSLQESQPFSSMQEHRIKEHETLWGFCGKWQRGRAPFPWQGTQLCKHSLALQGPVQGILLQISLSHIPCLHTNHFSIQMLSLPSKLSSPLCGLRGGSEVSGRLHFFHHYPSLLSSEIFLMPS